MLLATFSALPLPGTGSDCKTVDLRGLHSLTDPVENKKDEENVINVEPSPHSNYMSIRYKHLKIIFLSKHISVLIPNNLAQLNIVSPVSYLKLTLYRPAMQFGNRKKYF